MSFTIEGNECLPALKGGYLFLTLDGEDFWSVSVPSPNLLAERYRDSVAHNMEEVDDDEGNQYELSVISSNVGVDWSLTVNVSQNTDENQLKRRINVELKPNDF